jgi:hypothetical protein
MNVKSPVEVQVRNPVELVRMRNPLPAIRIPNPIAWVARPVVGARDDIRRIAQGMSALPELVRVLTTIQAQTQSLDLEVRSMRAEVAAVNARLDAMGLDAKLEDVADAVHPFRRALRRFKKRSTDPSE